MTRPLWQLLMLIQQSKEDVDLTCNECFTLLEYDADLLVSGAEFSEINSSVKKHLQLCSRCRNQLKAMIEKKERLKGF
jgi:predicted anti-sigma-YlaC factor YlaD